MDNANTTIQGFNVSGLGFRATLSTGSNVFGSDYFVASGSVNGSMNASFSFKIPTSGEEYFHVMVLFCIMCTVLLECNSMHIISMCRVSGSDFFSNA
jgi:hypothetical protein